MRNETISIRLALLDEIPKLWELRTRAVKLGCSSHYTEEELRVWSASPLPQVYRDFVLRGNALVAEDEDRLVGYAMLNEKSAEVDAVFVDPDYSGRGIGKGLLREIERIAVARGLSKLHLSSSLNAVQFYEIVGFTTVSSDEYPDPNGLASKCVFMEKDMTNR